MKEKHIVIFNVFKLIISSIIFYVGIHFENATKSRLYILITILIIYLAIGIVRKQILRKNTNLYSYSFLIDIILIYLLEYNSRFLINYFFHSFYIISLLEISLKLNKDIGFIIGIVLVALSQIKYIFLIYYEISLANISEMVFFLMVNILILIIVYFAQYNKEEKEKKEILYKELLEAYKKLKDYAERVKELSKVEERTRIAREIHDSLGHNMTALIMEMEIAGHMIEEDKEKAMEYINRAKSNARKGLINIRRVVETLRNEEGQKNNLESIKKLIEEFSKRTNINISFYIDEEVFEIPPIIGNTLYRIIQESMTNALRHGKATEIKIILKNDEDGLKFCISDNGVGAEDIKYGYGLKGMKERICRLKGKITFKSQNGFLIQGFIPLEVKE